MLSKAEANDSDVLVEDLGGVELNRAELVPHCEDFRSVVIERLHSELGLELLGLLEDYQVFVDGCVSLNDIVQFLALFALSAGYHDT